MIKEFSDGRIDAPDDERVLLGKTAIIAGSGQLPVTVAETLEKSGLIPFIVALRGAADPRLFRFPHSQIAIVEFAKLIKILKRQDIKNVVLAGGVRSRPHLSDLRFDLPTIKALPRLLYALNAGDDALLRAFIKTLESYKFNVLGAHQVVPELLAPRQQRLTKKQPSKADAHDIALAAKAAKVLGSLDIGQGAVAIAGRVIAVEGAEGTDNMLKRICEMRSEKRVPQKGGVLVKCAKPSQESRADLPTIGPKTIERLVECGLNGVAIEAENSFILQSSETITLANKYRIFITTFSPD